MLLDRTGTTSNPYLYRGEQYDPELQAYYLRARYYQPRIGRFLTTDPIEGFPGKPISLHRYLYGNNNPVNYLDPSGRMGLSEMVTVIAIINQLTIGVVSGQKQSPLQELTVALTAAGRDAGGFDEYGQRVAGDNRQQFKTGKDILNALQNWTRTNYEGADDTCIKNLYIFSHAWGYQSVWGERHGGGLYSSGEGGGPPESGFYGKASPYDHADARNINDLQTTINTGTIRFCETCLIVMTGCRIASTGDFATDLARVSSCTIRAAAGASNSTEAPDFTSLPGVWAETQIEGGVPWQEFTPTGAVRNIGETLTLW